MKKTILASYAIRLLLGLALGTGAVSCTSIIPDSTERHARNVTIARDEWGIPHIRGKSDADAVFGLIYAQAEDDFNRIEMNYLTALGRMSEAEGESRIYQDLRMRLFYDDDSLRNLYSSSPEWLKTLAVAWADGLNFFLATHPHVHPKVLTRFEPWMVLSLSEGSISWDIGNVSLHELEAFYGKRSGTDKPNTSDVPKVNGGSNGIAIAPALTASGASLLLINPHTSFFYRAEVQVQSDEGLNVYGAVKWGQFFIYQGFNEHLGWMHTSSGVDAIDEWAETIVERPEGLFYRYGREERPIASRPVTITYRVGDRTDRRVFTVYRTHHGPIVREADGRWIAVCVMQEPVKAISESYLRTKASNYDAFRKTVDLQTNSSDNTIYADADGNIAYFQASFIPRRDRRFDWSKPVDGSNPATDWQGEHSFGERPGLLNPANGWIQNTNNSPYCAAGPDSPQENAFPPYMDRADQNYRGLHAIRVLSDRKGFTLDSLIGAAFDPYLPAFDEFLPPLFEAYRNAPASDPLKKKVSEQIALLKGWDHRWSVESVATSLAVYWGEELFRMVGVDPDSESLSTYRASIARSTPTQLLEALASASDRLTTDFGTWKTPWGEINRFQRLTGDIIQPFNDTGPSIPVGFTSWRWGSLAVFDARRYPGTRRMYGTGGNSFVAVVEFGKTLKAKAITAGGESGDPKSPHFSDQAGLYATGALRDVHFCRQDLEKHIVKEYHPGQ